METLKSEAISKRLQAGFSDLNELDEFRQQIWQQRTLVDTVLKEVRHMEENQEKANKPALGFAYFLLGDIPQAISFLEQSKSGLEKYILARCLLSSGRGKKAAEIVSTLTEDDPKNVKYMCLRCETLIDVNDVPEAQKILQKLSKLLGDDPQVSYLEGLVLEKEGNYQDAVEKYEHCMGLASNSYRAAFRLGYILDLRGNQEEAMRYYRICSEARPAFAHAITNLGLIHMDREEYQQAVNCFRRVLEDYPNNSRVKLFPDRRIPESFLDAGFPR